jgi:hypothetical protein
MPPPHHPIYIHFIRRTANGRAQTDSRLDDTLQVQKLGENNVRVTYTERSEDGRIIDTTLMTYQRLIHYLYRIFWMLSLDEDPFQSVQLIVPGYPTTLIRVDTLRAQLGGVMDVLVNALWHWPTIGRPDGDTDNGARRDIHLVAGAAGAGAGAAAPPPAP